MVQLTLSDVEAGDLMVAVRKQHRFMEDILGSDDFPVSVQDKTRVVEEYLEFLQSTRRWRQGSDKAMEPPCKVVDAVWHMHMQTGERYISDCVSICERVVDHQF